MATRIWKGQKEMVTEPYFCGQVWNVKRQLWDTVTKTYASEKTAIIALAEYLEEHNAVCTPSGVQHGDSKIIGQD